jgi:hypothetical protein
MPPSASSASVALPCFRQPMIRRAEHHQFVRHPRFDDQIGVAAAAFDQAQIEFVARQLIDDRRRVVHLQMQRALGVAFEEIGDDQRRQVVADGQRRADAQLAVAGAAFEHAGDRRRPLDQLDRLRQQGLPEFVEAQVLPNRSKSWVSYSRSSSASAVLVADCDSESSRRHAKRSRAERPQQTPRSGASCIAYLEFRYRLFKKSVLQI